MGDDPLIVILSHIQFQIQFNSVTSIVPKSSEMRAQRGRIQIETSSKRKSSTGRQISEELGGESRIEKKSLQHCFK